MSPNSGLFSYSLAEAVPVQVPNIIDHYGSKSSFSFQLLLAQSFVSFTVHVLHGFFFPNNTLTNKKLSQSDSDDSIMMIRPSHSDDSATYSDSAMIIRPGHSDSAILTRPYHSDSAKVIQQPDRKSTRLNSSHFQVSRMPSSA